MGLLDSLMQSNQSKYGYGVESLGAVPTTYIPRGFRETIQDQIAYHKAKIEGLQAVIDSMTPEVEKFVEALQKVS